MSFEIKRVDLAGRIGRLQTMHGVLETPFLFPVVDSARQTPSLDFIRKLGFNGIITNAYLFFKRNRGKALKIHDELRWKDAIMTDSGGYQILVYGDVDVDNKTIVKYEIGIGSDIAVILDVPTGSSMSYSDAEKAVYETYRRGIEALPLISENPNQLWVYPIQGAPFKDLVVRSALLARKLPFDVYAVGSPTVMLEKYEYSKLVEIVAIARMHIPPSKPLHVFGVGHPMILPFLIAVGADLFDSASYILYARNGRYMTETGTKNIKELSYFPCTCPVCSKYTPQDLIEMKDDERTELLAMHNLYMLMKELKTIKQHIVEGRLWELLVYRSKSHPTLQVALEVVKKYGKLLEKFAPTSNPSGRATLLYSEDDLANPRIKINVRKAEKISLRGIENKVVIVVPAHRKPYNIQEEYLKTKLTVDKENINAKILLIHPILGIFTPGLAATYPYYQHKCELTKQLINIERVVEMVKKIARYRPQKIVLVVSSWLSDDLASKVCEIIARKFGVNVVKCRPDEISSHVLQ